MIAVLYSRFLKNTIISCKSLTIQHGDAASGGGLSNDGPGTVTLTNSTVTDNTGSYGGGIDHYEGTVNLTDSTVSDNTSDNEGGDIYNYWNATVNLTN